LRGVLLDAAGGAGGHPSALAAVAAQLGEWGERFRSRDSQAASWSLPQAATDILRAASLQQALLLLVDDAQWLDDDSYRAIESIARDLAAAPILILLATTPEPPHPGLTELRSRMGRDIPGETIALGTLGADALRALARWAFPAYSDDDLDRVARRVAVDSAGLALLAVEICHAIALGLDLNATAGAWPEPRRTLDQTLPGALPDTVVAAIRVGFRRLGSDAQSALVAAAIMGEPAPAAAIGRATALNGESLDRALDELEWQRWLVADPRGYSFVARIVREVVSRDMVTAGQRQRVLASHVKPPR
jgi:predicted ATPase